MTCTTCLRVLTKEIFDQGCKLMASGVNGIDLRDGICMAVDDVMRNLKNMARMINTFQEIAQVGTISADGEKELGELIANAIVMVDKEEIITIVDGSTRCSELQVVKCIKLERGYFTQHFITNQKYKTCELDDPLIFIHDQMVSNVQAIKVLEFAITEGRPLLILAEDVDAKAIKTMVAEKYIKGMKGEESLYRRPGRDHHTPHGAPELARERADKHQMVRGFQLRQADGAAGPRAINNGLPKKGIPSVDSTMDQQPAEELHPRRHARPPDERCMRREPPAIAQEGVSAARDKPSQPGVPTKRQHPLIYARRHRCIRENGKEGFSLPSTRPGVSWDQDAVEPTVPDVEHSGLGARGVRVCAVKVPGHGENMELNLLAIVTGGQIFTEENGMNLLPHTLGTCKKVIVSEDDCTIFGGAADDNTIENRTKQLGSATEKSTGLAEMYCRAAIMKIGGMDKLEIGEKKDRAIHALNATKAAVEEGIVPGDGVALVYAAKDLDKLDTANVGQKSGVQIIQNVLKIPFHTNASSAGHDGDDILSKILEQNNTGLAYDAAKGEYADMLEAGSIEPLKVIRTALMDVQRESCQMLTDTDGHLSPKERTQNKQFAVP
ncbi:chaperonin CPN60-2, mitochondrial [Triticum aestivum]|uniref:chaperonin CPN60-2, mitochondrial n=1 Tax=Triticum aestivum TaxID=4565 RepID=UPI001D00E8C9|nr:chaperonin CPN60-2, mitochondrial-like [Triticum aestivum]